MQRQQVFDRVQDAQSFDVSMRRAKQLGQLAAEVIGSEQTFASFVAEWWEKYALTYLAPGTLASYAPTLDRWVIPYLGPLRLRDVSRETMDAYVTAIAAAGAGAPTVNRCLAIVQGILRRAVEWRRLPANPAAGIPRLAHVRDDAIDARTPETVEAIRQTMALRDAVLVSLLAYEALRPAEAFALEWRDVLDDFGMPRDRLRVQRALSAHEISTTKSRRTREPELFGPVGRDLAELNFLLGRPARDQLVFEDARGSHLRRQNWRQRVWIPALATAFPCSACAGTGKRELRPCAHCRGHGSTGYFRLYDLRHTCATLLIYEGRSLTEVAEHLGHADPSVTARVYAHVFKDAAKARRQVPIEEAIASARRALAAQGSAG